MSTDDFESWVECLRRRRYGDLSAAVWDLLWLAAQHRRFALKPRGGVGLEFTVSEQEPRFYALGHARGWLRAVLARLAFVLAEHGVIAEGSGQYGFEARVRVPDGSGSERALDLTMKNNERDGFCLIVQRREEDRQPLPEAD